MPNSPTLNPSLRGQLFFSRRGSGSLGEVRLRPEHSRLVDAIHQLGDVLIAHVPQVKPVLEILGRGAWLLFEQLAPDLERFLPAAELAIERDGFNTRVIRLLIRVLPLQSERAFVVAV